MGKPGMRGLARILVPTLAVGVVVGVVMAVLVANGGNEPGAGAHEGSTTGEPGDRSADESRSVQFSAAYIGPRLAVVDSANDSTVDQNARCAEVSNSPALAETVVARSNEYSVGFEIRAIRHAVVDVKIILFDTISSESVAGARNIECKPDSLPGSAPQRQPQRWRATLSDTPSEGMDSPDALPDPLPDGVVPGGFSIVLAPGEVQPVELRAKHPGTNVVRWKIRLLVTIDGADQVIELDNRGIPFATVGEGVGIR
ncbi:hypothetical protein [Nocardia mexicana]|uniref:Uncharacterized protein n=1 Tax=Nocardia mexicana TaxID=279262 RepID=A0A370H4R8_9NOCA|nr:hypothetical protein [Nocardia mexicana]RDI51156.1 hypothetical protein DFR68_105634 [Nocardia mexicana]